jgi:hypothetical protein
MNCNVERPSCTFRNKKQECIANGCFEVSPECYTAKLGKDPCEKITKVTEKDYCLTYIKPPWRLNRACPLAITKLVVTEEKMINPLKASKKAAGGSKK